MRSVLFIIHATSWSDKACVAKSPIQWLISHGKFDRIIEIIQTRPDIRSGRYLTHTGTILEHEEISPVRFLRERLFGADPLFPEADEITLVGGVLNPTGGGCLNVAFGHMVRFCAHYERHCFIRIPVSATYGAGGRQVVAALRRSAMCCDRWWKTWSPNCVVQARHSH